MSKVIKTNYFKYSFTFFENYIIISEDVKEENEIEDLEIVTINDFEELLNLIKITEDFIKEIKEK